MTFADGQIQNLGPGASFTVLYADGGDHSDFNENSTVVRVGLADSSLLPTRDAESGNRAHPSSAVGHTESHLLDHHRNAIDVDIL